MTCRKVEYEREMEAARQRRIADIWAARDNPNRATVYERAWAEYLSARLKAKRCGCDKCLAEQVLTELED